MGREPQRSFSAIGVRLRASIVEWRRSKVGSLVGRWVPIALSMVAAVTIAITLVASYAVQPLAFGFDQRYYAEVGARWLSDGTMYWPHQLAGPYRFTVQVDVLYPPIALLLFVPAALLPGVLWWGIPIAVIALAVAAWHPGRWAICLALFLTAYFRSTWTLIGGNTDLWAVGAIAGGLRWGWPGPLVLLKPTMAPFALAGIGRRSWWFGMLGLVAVGVLMLPLWRDYLSAMSNLRGIGASYLIDSIPLLLVPVVLWVGRRRPVSRTA